MGYVLEVPTGSAESGHARTAGSRHLYVFHGHGPLSGSKGHKVTNFSHSAPAASGRSSAIALAPK